MASEELRYREGAEFTGVIGRTMDDSVPAWPAPVRAPDGAPNVVVVLLDDTGFADLDCFGGVIRTPTFDRLAGNGLRYREFHTTAICTASRACLLTGRNHHANAAGRSGALGFPGYNMMVPPENGFLSEILRQRGYATFALGKWDLTPYSELAAGSSQVRWPLGRGFDRFYGFLGGRTSQWAPDLVYDNHPIDPPGTPEEGYHLNVDLADRGIGFISDLRAADPDKPFFMYYATGATHLPHHVPKEWADRYAGRFDLGWDRLREELFARQLDLGIVPEGTTLSPRPEWIPAWDDLDDQRRKVLARQMEVYAGYLEHTDHHIGRLIAFLEAIGELDNTLIMVTSDNGADGSDGPEGSKLRVGSIVAARQEGRSLDASLELVEDWGGPNTYPAYSSGWAWVGCTPLRRWKSWMHEGGISDPLIVHWPAGIRARGEVRPQYAHITDLTPTILDVLDVEPPATVDGVTQSRMHGVSLADTFDDPGAPTKKRVQYYEMGGSRAIWVDGWKAVTDRPVDRRGTPLTEQVLAGQRWELFHMADDFSECHDVADQHPERLRQLVEQWWAEAGKYDLLPVGGKAAGRRPPDGRQRSRFVYYPGAAPVLGEVTPDVTNRSHRISAELEIPAQGAEGVLLAHGGIPLGGYTLYVKDQRLHYVHNHPGIAEQRISSEATLPTGAVTVVFEFTKTGEHQGTAVLRINGNEAAQGNIHRTSVAAAQELRWNEGLCCGYDSGQPVTTDYQTPYRFNATINRVVVDVVDE